MPDQLVDSHCHLADVAFAPDLDAVVARGVAAGLSAALCILSADEPDEVSRAAVVRTAWPAVRLAAAVHPHRAGAYGARPVDAVRIVSETIAAVGADAVGEMGLDYHYDFAPRDAQREVFSAQAELAVSRNLPIVVHTRDATDDTLAVLREAGSGLRGVMHCFSGPVEEARAFLDLGFFISLSGIVTFPKAGHLREVAAFVPEDRLLIETDAPFLAPVPHRGKRNEPAWVRETLNVVAMARRTEPNALEARVGANFRDLLGRASTRPPR
jgi:TatD DNase family protein